MSEITKYESAYGLVELSPEVVTKYLKRGNKDLTQQEVALFINLCKYQGLNPWIGEAYAIKFGDEFQMIVGYDTYKRRAEENPSYRGRESGIVVLRGEQVIQKKGTCLYPGEQLLGGWCRVVRELNGRDIEEYKEVSLAEYNKGQANWKTKPCTMIEKVAVSQALRAAFPKDFTGMYTAEEMGSDTQSMGAAAPGNEMHQQFQQKNEQQAQKTETTGKPLITKEQRKHIFDLAKTAYGDQSVEQVRDLCAALGFNGTGELTQEAYESIVQSINADLQAMREIEADGSVE